MKILDLAKTIAPEAKVKIIGIKPGEKLHEVLLTKEEATHSREFDNCYIVEPEFRFWDKDNFKEDRHLIEDFDYTSGGNNKWITKEQMAEILRKLNID